MSTVESIFRSSEGLRKGIPGFAPREPQIAMAQAVESCIAGRESLIVEAETGTGKTLAYLGPALLAAGPTIISTGTRNLQEQLFFRDLPAILKALGVYRRVALLKGRSNYLCPQRLAMHLEEIRFQSRETVQHLQMVAAWAAKTATGDLGELTEIPEEAAVWPWITSTTENCLGQDCPDYERCPLMRARQEAHEADLVVVNHHLFFAAAAVKREANTELLPEAATVIFDEAHQLPEVAALFYGEGLTSRQIQELLHDVMGQASGSAADFQALNTQCAALEKAAADFRLALGTEGRKEPWAKVAEESAVQEAVAVLVETYQALAELLAPLARHSREFESCARRAEEQFLALVSITSGSNDNFVYWFETFRRSFSLNATPLSVAGLFNSYREKHPASWIFTSATLSVSGRFEHFSRRLGIEDAKTLRLESPFDFRKQAVLYVPEDLPEPAHADYIRRLVGNMIPVIEAAKGRTFFLFTSHRALKEAAELLKNRLPYPLFIQGEMGRRQLLDAFREAGNGVLLGTSSFWEGIDVRGEALSCVIIDRLPFASPGDPVVAARIERMQKQGGNPFRDFQLPHAVLTLRQGAGRLIRDTSDYGVLVLADSRLLEKSYGRLFLNSLPGMTKTRKLEVVQRFFVWIEQHLSELKQRETAGD